MKKEKNVLGILFTDLHLDDVNKDVCEKFMHELRKGIEEQYPRFVAFLGDFFDQRQGLTEPVLNSAKNFFKKLKESCANIPIFVIPGNHDKFVESDIPNYLQVYSQYFELFSEVNLAFYNNREFFFFPYFEGKIFEEQINKLEENLIRCKKEGRENVLCAHYMYEQLPEKITKYCDKIFLGHNHEKENFPKGEYIGSCIQRNFEEDNQKGYTLLYDDLSTEQIIFEDREFVSFNFNLSVKTEQELKDFVLKFKREYPNKHLRIVIEGFDKDISQIQMWLKEQEVSFKNKIDNLLKAQDTTLNLKSKISKEEFRQKFEEFCQLESIDTPTKNYLTNILFPNDNDKNTAKSNS